MEEITTASALLGEYTIVRTYSAGVFAGILAARDGKEGLLTEARRIWYWDGAASLSALAATGTSKPARCKFAAPVAKVLVTEVIEALSVTDTAKASIDAVPVWTIE